MMLNTIQKIWSVEKSLFFISILSNSDSTTPQDKNVKFMLPGKYNLFNFYP